MTKLYRRLGALAVLGVTAGVSMLAGSVLLGSASADEPDTKTQTTSTAPAFSIAYAGAVGFGAGEAGQAPSCVVAYRAWTNEDGDPPVFEKFEGAPTFSVKALKDGDIESAIASGKIKVLEGGKAENVTISIDKDGTVSGKRIEIKPGQEPKITELNANDLEGFEPGKPFTMRAGELPEGFTKPHPEDCKVLNEDGTITLPDGTTVKPAASIKIP